MHLAPVPGTDLLLLNAMAQVICAEGLVDTAFIEQHVRFSDGQQTVDFAAFTAFLAQYTPEAVAAELGIAAPQIRDAAFRFARSQATMSLWTMGINQRTQGVFLNNMLNALHLITGHIGRPGATPFSLTGQSNACGGVRDTGALAHLLPKPAASPTRSTGARSRSSGACRRARLQTRRASMPSPSSARWRTARSRRRW